MVSMPGYVYESMSLGFNTGLGYRRVANLNVSVQFRTCWYRRTQEELGKASCSNLLGINTSALVPVIEPALLWLFSGSVSLVATLCPGVMGSSLPQNREPTQKAAIQYVPLLQWYFCSYIRDRQTEMVVKREAKMNEKEKVLKKKDITKRAGDEGCKKAARSPRLASSPRWWTIKMQGRSHPGASWIHNGSPPPPTPTPPLLICK